MALASQPGGFQCSSLSQQGLSPGCHTEPPVPCEEATCRYFNSIFCPPPSGCSYQVIINRNLTNFICMFFGMCSVKCNKDKLNFLSPLAFYLLAPHIISVRQRQSYRLFFFFSPVGFYLPIDFNA